jgi:aminoglycoside phosphotransferase (APT) family kinase protein
MREDHVAQDRIADFFASAASSTKAVLNCCQPLRGGAVQQNYRIDVHFADGPFAGSQELVLRTDSPTKLVESKNRPAEFRLQRFVFEAGVRVAEPLWVCEDMAVIGKEFYVMRRLPGRAWGSTIVAYAAREKCGVAIAEALGSELAVLHAITQKTPGTDFLGALDDSPSPYRLSKARNAITGLSVPQPILEWGIRWLQRSLPAPEDIVLAHRDFRTGNYLLAGNELTGLLDWEFSGWSDPHEDIGWFCARCWRFGHVEFEAGGIAFRDIFYRAYEQRSGRLIDPDKVFWWEVFAHLRWAIIALQQGERFSNGGELSMDLALTNRRIAEISCELLAMIAPSASSKLAYA